MPPRTRRPHISFNGQIATLTTSAESILSPKNETHVIVFRNADGTICLQPLRVGGMIDVVKIHRYANKRNGAPRIHLGCISHLLEPGRYELGWNASAGAACLTKVSDVTPDTV